MKLSNKLLIGVGVSLFTLILSIVVVANIGGVDQAEYWKSIENEAKNFNSESKYLKGAKLNTYRSISIKSEHSRGLYLHLIKDATFAYKSNSELNEVEVSADNEGLILNFKTKSFQYLHVYLYAPHFENVTLSNLNLDELVTSEDSLKLDILNASWGSYNIDNESLKSLDLSLTNSSIDNTLKIGKLENLNLKLTNSAIKLQPSSIKGLAVQAENSKFAIEEPNGPTTISSLSVVTQGKSTISLPTKISVDKIEGNLSDSTSTNFPVFLLKNLIK
ncbi:hypothetical protein [Sphingobacterium composti Ten et al. 2007 non Yoo et al. 2007]|uniref:hypothetical protein n=1 Tax=Sphingobacterium composti TaxID=363260 RepID=UPI0013582BC5|nr:hypothetical protein [Sphingobacterium composti Ten et al. 2007 non Yoo et al. 2007]